MIARLTASRKASKPWRIGLAVALLVLASLWMSGLAAQSDRPRIATNAASKPAPTGDPARGQLLYENHCRECHTSGVHIRERRSGTNEAQVRAWIITWERRLALQWTEQERSDVYHFLNDRYYRFSASP